MIEQCGSKTRINRIIADLRSCLQQAEELNVQYLSFVPEIEHDKVIRLEFEAKALERKNCERLKVKQNCQGNC